jgi:hypothetical protein
MPMSISERSDADPDRAGAEQKDAIGQMPPDHQNGEFGGVGAILHRSHNCLFLSPKTSIGRAAHHSLSASSSNFQRRTS